MCRLLKWLQTGIMSRWGLFVVFCGDFRFSYNCLSLVEATLAAVSQQILLDMFELVEDLTSRSGEDFLIGLSRYLIVL